jgi:DNA polymerase elongation subunit (family B)
MTNSFYTNVQVYGSRILYRGIENGFRVTKKIDYNPTLYVSSKTHTGFHTIHGEFVSEIKPGNIRDCRDFIKQYEGVDGFNIFGNQRYEYSYIADNFDDHIDWDIADINVANIDIEVGSENGFPEPDAANEPITAITIKTKLGFRVFGCGDFINNREDVTYVKCKDEFDLIYKFIDAWSGNKNYPDIITGWNTKFFDIPYLVNRITKLCGEATAKRLSPWGVINQREVNFGPGRQFKTYSILGIASLDYIDLYQRYAPDGKSQESYKLDAIANVELGERKLSYEEYGNLHTLYRDNYQLFIEYNIRDVELIDKLDDKLKLIELVLTLAYDSKTNYEDAFTQVRMWDIIIFNHLRKKSIVIPQNTTHQKDSMYEGAFVKDPLLGMHKWVASFDLNSLYPHLIMQWNISPDTIIEPEHYDSTLREFMSNNTINVDNLLNQSINTSVLKTANVTLTPNGQFFTKERHGFLPELMETMYNDRSAYKKKAIEAKKELEKESDPAKRFDIEKRIARYNNLQLAKKVSLNSAYGALGNEFFRFFDIRQASGITTSGQLAIRWIEKKINEYMNKLLKTENTDYVIAVDTDSIYLSLDTLVSKTIVSQKPHADTREIIKFMDKACEDRIQPFIDGAYSELAEYINAYAQKMQMKREALADKGIWTAKKRYILNVHNNEGVEYAKPKVKVMGLEMIKSSTPAYCRKIMWEAIDIVLNKKEDDLIGMIETWRQEFRSQSIAEISFPRGVNGLQKFSDKTSVFGKGCPIHVRGSLLYNHLIKTKKLEKNYPFIKEGEKIKFIFLKEPNFIQSNVIAYPQMLPEEFDLHKHIDYDTQFEKSFVESLKIILDSINWKTEKISSLEDFFG